MKHPLFVALFLFSLGPQLKAADLGAWQFTQPIPVESAGLTRSVLAPSTLDVARPGLEDLRVISPTGIENPYLIQWPSLQPARTIHPAAFEMQVKSPQTELTLTTGTSETIRAIHLQAASTRFLKSLKIETSADQSIWTGLVAGAVVFRENNGQESLSIQIPKQSYAHLRIVMDDRLSPPVAFTGALIELDTSTPTESGLATTLIKREELPGKTRFSLGLGGKNIFLARLRIETSEPIFNRRINTLVPSAGDPDHLNQKLASATIFRLAVGDQSSSSLDVPIHQSVAHEELIVEIENGDSPPLKIDGIEATQHPIQIVFQAGETGTHQLFSGNPLAAAPRYDVATMSREIFSSPATDATLGVLSKNLNYSPATPLPDIHAKGINIDLADSQFRRSIHLTSPGVIALELDPELISHAQNSMADVRLIQSGRQIPFIIDYASGPWDQFVEPSITSETDIKHSTITRWTVTLPHDSLLAGRITCTSPSPLFDRSIRAWAIEKDGRGNETTHHLGSAHWTRKPGDSKSEFTLSFDQPRIPHTFFLESDNGDNPPIELQRPRIYYPTIHLIAKLDETTAAYLYYGNDRAKAPSYDLQLVAHELRTAPRQKATIGPKEPLKPTARNEVTSIGSPWLWVALALAVSALLWTVSRMLPPAESKGQ